jgi:organic radical activating enzyme
LWTKITEIEMSDGKHPPAPGLAELAALDEATGRPLTESIQRPLTEEEIEEELTHQQVIRELGGDPFRRMFPEELRYWENFPEDKWRKRQMDNLEDQEEKLWQLRGDKRKKELKPEIAMWEAELTRGDRMKKYGQDLMEWRDRNNERLKWISEHPREKPPEEEPRPKTPPSNEKIRRHIGNLEHRRAMIKDMPRKQVEFVQSIDRFHENAPRYLEREDRFGGWNETGEYYGRRPPTEMTVPPGRLEKLLKTGATLFTDTPKAKLLQGRGPVVVDWEPNEQQRVQQKMAEYRYDKGDAPRPEYTTFRQMHEAKMDAFRARIPQYRVQPPDPWHPDYILWMTQLDKEERDRKVQEEMRQKRWPDPPPPPPPE